MQLGSDAADALIQGAPRGSGAADHTRTPAAGHLQRHELAAEHQMNDDRADEHQMNDVRAEERQMNDVLAHQRAFWRVPRPIDQGRQHCVLNH